jgi:hypothetical protein
LAYYRLIGFRPERLDFRLHLRDDLASWGADHCGVALPLTGITLDPQFAHEVPGLLALNKTLARQVAPGLVCLGYKPLELKQRLRLPLLFPLYACCDLYGLTGALAIGREALLLDTVIHSRGLACGGQAVIV